jgi:hypothetical protein
MIGRSMAQKLVPALLFLFVLSLKFSVIAPIDFNESASLRHLPAQTIKRLIVDRVQGISFSTLTTRPAAPAGFWLWNDPGSIAQVFGRGFFYADVSADKVFSFTRPLYLVLQMLVI